MNITRVSEYLGAAVIIGGGGLWVGTIQSTAADTATAVQGLPEKVAVLDTKIEERTKAIKESIDDLKKQQAEQARLILEAIQKKK